MRVPGFIYSLHFDANYTAVCHSIQTSAQIDTNQPLSSRQLSEVLSQFSIAYREPDQCYEHHLLLRNRRATGIGVKTSTNQFWLSPNLRTFSSSHYSAMVVLKGIYTSRWAMQDFGVNVIRALNASNIPAAWALAGANKRESNGPWNSTDLIKYLTWQILRMGTNTEKLMAIRHSQLQTSQTLTDWLGLFRQVLEHQGGQIYLIIDMTAVESLNAEADGCNIMNELEHLVSVASMPSITTEVKIVLLIYETSWARLLPPNMSGLVIPVRLIRGKQPRKSQMKQSAITNVLAQRGKRDRILKSKAS